VLVLALDTTTRGGSAAVVRDDRLLALIDGDQSRTHGERLPAEIELALARAEVASHELDLLAVANGPGAFTGLRIGLATIQGMAMVLRKPVVGVSALEALADAVWHEHPTAPRIVTWMDAHRGEVFAASFARSSDPNLLDRTEPIVSAPESALLSVPFSRDQDVFFAGDGAVRYKHVVESAWGPRARVVDPVPALAPSVARLGLRRAATGAAGPPHTLQPVYVRRPDAQLDRERHGNA
jgi:tRNA threonylcarbamoyladenosine biosynthesis protein TsaB